MQGYYTMVPRIELRTCISGLPVIVSGYKVVMKEDRVCSNGDANILSHIFFLCTNENITRLCDM